jgi:putative transposase
MSQSLSEIIVHVIFSTKNRQPFLNDRAIREESHRYLGGILARIDCQPLVIGGVADHVHVLCMLNRTGIPSALVKELKRGSSLWLKNKSPELRSFAWQSGYAMFSLGHSQVEVARKYIVGQESRHRKISFQDELRQFLKRYEMPCDERYIWD